MPPITHVIVHPLRGRGDLAAGLKGQLFEATLHGCDIFTGPNGAGKTSRLLAIVAATHGLGSTSTDPRRPYLETTPTDTGVTIHTGAGSFTRELDASTRTKAHKEADELARQYVGQLPVSWDLSDWARSSSGERSKVLDAIARAGGAIESWGVARAQQEAELAEAGDWHRLCCRALPGGEDGASWLAAAIDWAELQRLQSGKSAKAEAGAAAGVKISGDRPGGQQDDRRERDLLIEERASLRDTGGARRAALADLQRHERRGEELRTELERIVADGKRLAVEEAKPEESRDPKLVEAVESIREQLAETHDVGLGPATQAHLRAREKLDEARALAGEARGEACSLRGLQADAICVYCSTPDPLGVGRRLEQAEVRLDEAADALRAAEYADQKATEALEDLERAQAYRYQLQRDLQRAEKALADEAPAHARRVAAWERREASRKDQLQASRQRWLKVGADLKAWQQSTPPAVPAEEDHSERLQAIETELQAIQARETERADWDASSRASVQAAQRAEKAMETHQQCRRYVDHLRAVRDLMAERAFAPIQDAARQLVDGQDTLPRPYFRGPDSYGADCGRGEVPYHDLSKSEKVITAAVLVYALTVVSCQPCRIVLLDELEAVQRRRRPALLAALAAGVRAGHVNNVVCTLACEEDEELPDVPGVTYHRLRLEDRRERRVEAVEPVMSDIEPEPYVVPDVPAATDTDDCPF